MLQEFQYDVKTRKIQKDLLNEIRNKFRKFFY